MTETKEYATEAKEHAGDPAPVISVKDLNVSPGGHHMRVRVERDTAHWYCGITWDDPEGNNPAWRLKRADEYEAIAFSISRGEETRVANITVDHLGHAAADRCSDLRPLLTFIVASNCYYKGDRQLVDARPQEGRTLLRRIAQSLRREYFASIPLLNPPLPRRPTMAMASVRVLSNEERSVVLSFDLKASVGDDFDLSWPCYASGEASSPSGAAPSGAAPWQHQHASQFAAAAASLDNGGPIVLPPADFGECAIRFGTHPISEKRIVRLAITITTGATPVKISVVLGVLRLIILFEEAAAALRRCAEVRS